MKKATGVMPEVAPNQTYIHKKFGRTVTVTKIDRNLVYLHWLFGNGPQFYTKSAFLKDFRLVEGPSEEDTAST